MKIQLSLSSEPPKRFKDIFPPFHMPEPDFTSDELIKESKPIKGIAVEGFRRIMEEEMARRGRTPNGGKES